MVCYNRTYVELKLVVASGRKESVCCYNRTYVELKLEFLLSIRHLSLRYNRTYVELKRQLWCSADRWKRVIIALM